LWQDVADQLEKQQTGEWVFARIFVRGILRGYTFHTFFLNAFLLPIPPY
jgi:hypothetical protein